MRSHLRSPVTSLLMNACRLVRMFPGLLASSHAMGSDSTQ